MMPPATTVATPVSEYFNLGGFSVSGDGKGTQAIGREGHTADQAGVPAKAMQFLAAGHIPENDGLVIPARQQTAPIARKRQAEDNGRMGEQMLHDLAGQSGLKFAEVVRRMLDRALDDEGTRKRLLELGSVLPDKNGRSQQALLNLVKSEIARWTPIIQAANVKME